MGTSNIDFSQVDFIIGVAFGACTLALVVFFAVKMKFINFSGNHSNCPIPTATMVCPDHSGITENIGFLSGECKAIWSEVKDINLRQINLREKLPKEYVSREDMAEIKGRLKTIDEKLDAYFLRISHS